ncbi:MAG: hypothetical protein LBQ24_04960 [Candidatus Peribacteria bacterium]|nr:hypothetical protein [Candidatus Peribacteria bacterium]
MDADKLKNIVNLSILMGLDFLVLFILVKKYYQDPIKKLELTLKRFIV